MKKSINISLLFQWYFPIIQWYGEIKERTMVWGNNEKNIYIHLWGNNGIPIHYDAIHVHSISPFAMFALPRGVQSPPRAAGAKSSPVIFVGT